MASRDRRLIPIGLTNDSKARKSLFTWCSFVALARVADCVGALTEQVEAAKFVDNRQVRLRCAYLQRKSHVLDAAAMMGMLGGVATSYAALLLLVGIPPRRSGIAFQPGLFHRRATSCPQ
jgi:hypothetical protein